MAYSLSPSDAETLGKALADYYEAAWEGGVKKLFDKMARSQMGVVAGYLDQAQDTYVALRKKSNDSFMLTFTPEVKRLVGMYFANKADVATDLLPLVNEALKKLISMIPLPVLPAVLSKLSDLATGEAVSEARRRAEKTTDDQVSAISGTQLESLFSTEEQALEYIKATFAQYKTVGRFTQTLPKSITTLDDALTFPAAVFKMQKSVSSMNVAIDAISRLVTGMELRLGETQKALKGYQHDVRTKMPAAAKAVVDNAYQQGNEKGKQHIASKKYSAPAMPQLQVKPNSGGATQLAAYVAYAVALGYYEAGNTGVLNVAQMPQRPGGPPPLPPRPGMKPLPPKPGIKPPLPPRPK